MRFWIFLILFCGQISQSFAANILSGRESRAVLNLHNSYRASVGVPRLKIDDSIVKSALKWANTLEGRNCPLEHSDSQERNRYGENLYAQWASPGLKFNPTSGVQMWGDEWIDYTYFSNTCAPNKVCGHYTQMIWRSTTAIGCARAKCTNSGVQTDILICQYNPAGNYFGTKPY